MTLNSINDIKHCFYINLDYRIDRRASVEKELEKIGLKNVTTRFNAIKTENGRIGCSMSHLKCLKLAKENNWDHILICEDDIQFLDEALFLNHFNKFLSTHNNWDVVLLAGNNVPPYIKIDDTCVKVSHCQTTTGYLVKSHYYDKLIDNITKGIKLLLKEPENHRLYAVDMYWLSLQKTDNWVLIIPPTVVQREDYSDIERRNTNYKNLMTDLDKQHLYKNNIVSCIVMGGLGNQLFQLFNAMAYAIRHDKRIVLPYKKQNADSRGDKISYWENILSPIKNLISYSFLNAPIYKEPYFKYKEIPNVNKSFVFDGYFQSYKYF
jgi:glycosyl transferase family 25